MKTSFIIAIVSVASALWVNAQGMPAASRDNIHKLFDNHAAVARSVTLTETGYIAVTESDDPQVAKTIRSHVNQMQERVESGLPVRRWDPAYDEMSRHYKDLSLVVESTPKGLRVVMTGKTPEAIKVAHNHAKIVSEFANRGWPEHDVEHPAVAQASTPAADGVPAAAVACCKDGAKCAKTEDESKQCCGRCDRSAPAESSDKPNPNP